MVPINSHGNGDVGVFVCLDNNAAALMEYDLS